MKSLSKGAGNQHTKTCREAAGCMLVKIDSKNPQTKGAPQGLGSRRPPSRGLYNKFICHLPGNEMSVVSLRGS